MPKYGEEAQKEVKKAVEKYQKGKLHSGRGHVTVKSRRQAIAIGLSKARKHGAKVPPAPKS